ncbi:hypothetical protein KL938_000068 [Ogataea parapolymorpha]|nr:hypothetical protein KL938_000068 [Ogataea parapolymorpha]
MTQPDSKTHIVVGVLSVQGSFREHLDHLNVLFTDLNSAPEYSHYQFSARKVKQPKDLDGLSGIILVGGESTTMSLLLQHSGLFGPLAQLIQSGKIGVWGTCAGLILIANQVTNTKVDLGDCKFKVLGGLDVSIERNSFGRQVDSFTQVLSFQESSVRSFECVFIRAPVVSGILSEKPTVGTKSSVVAEVFEANNHPVEVLSEVEKDRKTLIVAVRQGHILGTSFHPELVQDYRFHKWFVDEFVLKRSIDA